MLGLGIVMGIGKVINLYKEYDIFFNILMISLVGILVFKSVVGIGKGFV